MLAIKTQFRTQVKFADVAHWHIEVLGPIRVLEAINPKGARRQVVLCHTVEEGQAVLDELEKLHEKSGDEMQTVAARDVLIWLRTRARKIARATRSA